MAGSDLFLGHLVGNDPESISTPFELWCEEKGVRPDHPSAWDAFSLATGGLQTGARQVAS